MYDRLKAELQNGAIMDERTRRWIEETGEAIEAWRGVGQVNGDSLYQNRYE